MSCDSPPSQEDPQGWRPEIGRHADQVAHKADLGFADLGHGVAEVVVGRYREDIDPFAVGDGTQFAAARRRPIERIAVRPLAVYLDPVIAILLRPADHRWKRQSFPAVPESQVGDAIESQSHRNSSLEAPGEQPRPRSWLSLEPASRPEDGVVDQRPVLRIAKNGGTVSQLD